MSEEQMMRKRYYAARFACWELHLFLDTHPNNKEAARRLEEYQARAQRLGKEYEEKFGPLGETTQEMYAPLLQTDLTPEAGYAWLKDPWPWEEGGND